MWTKEHRARHEPRLKDMVSQWAEKKVARWLEQADPPRSAAATPRLAVVRAIAWHLRVGGPWRALPLHLPPWWTVYGWFRGWPSLGLFDRLMCEVAVRRRHAAGRRSTPSLAIINTQTVKYIAVHSPRGCDPARLMVGRKRVALVDADGVWLAINTVPASVQERDTLPALDVGSTHWPSLRLAIFDGGFTVGGCREWANFHGLRHHVVNREPGPERLCFAATALAGRAQLWLVWHWGGLLRDRAGRLDV